MTSFVWTEFYSEFATSLLKYANDRAQLIEMVKQTYRNIRMKLPTLEKDNNIVDIDPFTIFGLFNKGISNENRITILSEIKKQFGISAIVPTNFDGIPVLDNRAATFYYFSGERGEQDIDNLWHLFRHAIAFADNHTGETEFSTSFNTVISQKGASWNITMALYWIRPLTFINLDSRNRKLLENNQNRFKPDIDVNKMLKRMVSAEDYLLLSRKTKEILTEYDGFPEISFAAWKKSTGESKLVSDNGSLYWPSLEEYNPNLSKEDWKKYILEVELPKHPSPMQMLKAMMELGGEASCKQLSQLYGGSVSAYVGCSVSLGKRVKKFFDLPSCMDRGQERFFPIPFLGRDIIEDGSKSYCYKIRPELYEALQEIDLSHISAKYEEGEEMSESIQKTDVNRNTILYGPPGTGKTYNTVVYAVAIIENKPLAEVKKESYSEVLKRYNTYKVEGLIEFTTFHQSYGYEEFIEGIRPTVLDDGETENSGNIQYSVQPGVFKKFCEKADRLVPANSSTNDLGINENATIWKVSLWSTGDNEIRSECLKNGHIRIGWDQYGKDITDETDFSSDGGRVVLNAFMKKMQIGDIVLSCYSASTIDAIGVVTGEYEWHNEYYELKRLRKVNWIVKNIRENIMVMNGGRTMTLASVYRLSNISVFDVYKLIEKHTPAAPITITQKRNYVFIIDEINRGNISKIFGELITLIEETKRIGQSEGMKAKLPYSQQLFGVPDNMYIIGTMNTADRSIAAIDTALRRRFRFKEMMPNTDILKDIIVEDVPIGKMLDKMNRRISVLYDREHTIGHAYFVPLRDNPTIEHLAEIFENAVIPLLQEYFYEDYEKIRLVLGDNNKESKDLQFIIPVDTNYGDLFGNTEVGFDDSITYEINHDAFGLIEAYGSI